MMSRRLGAALGGAALLATAWIAALPQGIGGPEEAVFRAVNDLPDWIEYPGWPVMQVGSILAVPLVAMACLAFLRDWRLPLRIVVAGGGAWIVAKVIKEIVERGRPSAFLSEINLRPAWEGLGFVSGHAAVAFAIAVVLTPVINRRWRTIVWGLAVVSGLLRIYTGAHLPLDILGGWGLGLATGSIVLLWGHRRRGG